MSCPVCSAAETAYFDEGRDALFEATDETFTLLSCLDCRCLFLDPMPTPDQVAKFYPSRYWWDNAGSAGLGRLESIYRRLVLVDHVRFIARAARQAAPAGRARILDVGCGPGTVLSLLRERGLEVMGLDPSPHAARVARQEHGIEVAVGTLETAGLEEASFDTIILLHALEHVPNPRDVLGEAGRLLRSDGRLVLQVPNIDSLQFRAFGVRWYGLDVPRHLIDYSRRSLFRLLGRCGFQVERARHFNLRDNAPALASSLFPSLDPVSRAVRRVRGDGGEASATRWMRHLAYLGVVILCYPPAAVESALGRGATLMVQARKAS